MILLCLKALALGAVLGAYWAILNIDDDDDDSGTLQPCYVTQR